MYKYHYFQKYKSMNKQGNMADLDIYKSTLVNFKVIDVDGMPYN